MTNLEPPVWLPPPPGESARPARTSHRGAMVAVLGAGVAAGAAAAITLSAGAATDNGAGSAPSGNGLAAALHGPGMQRMSGTVTAVDTGKSTVTIKTASGTTTYAVDSHSDIDKSGEANLAALKAGDAVTFSTVTTNGKATIAVLHAGDESKNIPSGGFGHGGPGRLDNSGTVTAVDTGKSTVTIKTASGTTTYAVDSHSDIDKSGEANLAALKAGDAVTFSTVTTNGKATIAILHAGDESKNRPAGGFGGRAPGGWGAAGVPGAPEGAAPNG